MPKNIVHVLSSFKVGGAERLVLDLAQVQHAGGDRVAVFSCNSAEDALYGEFAQLDAEGLLSTGSRLADYKMLWAWFPAGTDSVCHIHSPAALRYLSPLLPLFKLRGVSMVYTRHGVAPLESKAWGAVHAWARFFIKSATFVSNVGLEVFYKRFGWSRSKLSPISNGVFVPENGHGDAITSRSSIRIGSVGRMVELKAQSHLLNVVSEIQKAQPDLKIDVHFFGDGPERKALEAQSEKGLTPGSVTFHGMELDRERVYGNFDLLVVCSEQEGLSLAIMEAMARGVPVIATAVGDSPKLVINDQTGLLYEYADLRALKRKLTDLLTDPERIKQLGSGARQHILEQYSLQKTNHAYQLVY